MDRIPLPVRAKGARVNATGMVSSHRPPLRPVSWPRTKAGRRAPYAPEGCERRIHRQTRPRSVQRLLAGLMLHVVAARRAAENSRSQGRRGEEAAHGSASSTVSAPARTKSSRVRANRRAPDQGKEPILARPAGNSGTVKTG